MPKRRTLVFRLDYQARVPAYLQIFRHVQRLAAAGQLSPGDQLPTVRELARQLGLNFNTTARAYRALHAAGIVTTQPGRGTFVLEVPSGRAVTRSRRKLLEALAQEYVAESRRQGFSQAEMLAALRSSLAPGRGA